MSAYCSLHAPASSGASDEFGECNLAALRKSTDKEMDDKKIKRGNAGFPDYVLADLPSAFSFLPFSFLYRPGSQRKPRKTRQKRR
jgi:hypothetical protein